MGQFSDWMIVGAFTFGVGIAWLFHTPKTHELSELAVC
jgi:hypothetical protein